MPGAGRRCCRTFVASKTTRKAPSELHGRGGPIAIRRWRRDELIPTQRAFFEVCRRLGFPEVADHNHPEASGVGPFPQNRRGRLRLSTAIAYLLPARQRPNLTIRPQCLVSRVLFEGQRAVGIEVAVRCGSENGSSGGASRLAAGAIGSPAILMRSGIGPKAALLDLGIDPLVDLPGVGAGLMDHPVTRLLLVPRPGSCDPQTPLAQVVVRYTAPGSDEINDMQLVMFSHVDVAGIGGQQAVATVGTPLAIGLPVALERPLARGRLSLASTEPRVPPLHRAQLRRRPGGPAPARGRRPPRLAGRARAGDRPPHRPRRPAHRGDDELGRGPRDLRPRDRDDAISSLRHGADGAARTIRWP